MTERTPGMWRIVLPARAQRTVLSALAEQRSQRLKRARTTAEGHPARLVGEREGHRRVDHPPERLDRVELQRRQVVKAIEQHRRAAPQRGALAQRVERQHCALLGVYTAETLQP